MHHGPSIPAFQGGRPLLPPPPGPVPPAPPTVVSVTAAGLAFVVVFDSAIQINGALAGWTAAPLVMSNVRVCTTNVAQDSVAIDTTTDPTTIAYFFATNVTFISARLWPSVGCANASGIIGADPGAIEDFPVGSVGRKDASTLQVTTDNAEGMRIIDATAPGPWSIDDGTPNPILAYTLTPPPTGAIEVTTTRDPANNFFDIINSGTLCRLISDPRRTYAPTIGTEPYP